MKNSKVFLNSLLATFFVLFAVMNSSAQKSETINEVVKAEIYKTTTKAEIFEIMKYLANQDIDLIIDKLEYSKNGNRIIEISGQISCDDGTAGSFQTGRFFRKIEIFKDDSHGAPVSFSITVR